MKGSTRRCSQCRAKVPAENALIGNLKAFCCYTCLRQYAASKSGQKAVERAYKREEVDNKRARREKLKTKSERLKDAQNAFNTYVRLRDCNKPCISCGSFSEQKVGGTRDCGHYLSRGAHSQHRYRLDNTASQCVKCNRYLSGNVANFRLGLIRRWGKDAIEELECDNEPRKFDDDYLDRLKSVFSRKAKLYRRLFR